MYIYICCIRIYSYSYHLAAYHMYSSILERGEVCHTYDDFSLIRVYLIKGDKCEFANKREFVWQANVSFVFVVVFY